MAQPAYNDPITAQPNVAPAMAQAPVSEKMPGQQQGVPGEFSTGFCSCCDRVGTSALVCCCPCLQYNKTEYRFENPEAKEAPMFGANCCIFYLLGYLGATCVLPCLQRGKIRERFGIEGNVGKDFLLACCCTCCVMVQNDSELAVHYGPLAGDDPIKIKQ